MPDELVPAPTWENRSLNESEEAELEQSGPPPFKSVVAGAMAADGGLLLLLSFLASLRRAARPKARPRRPPPWAVAGMPSGAQGDG
jgi:hypothetical protein